MIVLRLPTLLTDGRLDAAWTLLTFGPLPDPPEADGSDTVAPVDTVVARPILEHGAAAGPRDQGDSVR